jgi:diguanylate cyclase (GGDEF)-like protein
MTIRKKIVLFSALALGAFFVALYLVSRFFLLAGVARLESDYAAESVHRLQNELANRQGQLELVARDYAQWDRTYDFMKSRDPAFVTREITDDSFKTIRVDFLILLDQSGHLVAQHSMGDWKPEPADFQTLADARLNAPAKDSGEASAVNGILEIKGHLLLLAYQPITDSQGAGPARGTLVMGRQFDELFLSRFSKAAGLQVWMEPADRSRQDSEQETAWSDGASSVRFENDANMLEYSAVKDFYGVTRRLLVARIPRSLHLEGVQVMLDLLGFLMLAAVLYCAALFFLVQTILLSRVALLTAEVTRITVSGDLSLRVSLSGRDELGKLATALNAMLTAIQKTKSDLMQTQTSLRFHAEHDGLTGVLNRRAIRDLLRKELARCRREKGTLGVILADVDHFKKINDRFGHGAGDAVLVAAMQRISSALRIYDVVGRYGGEEFLIIAPGCDLDVAQKLAERIRIAVSETPVDIGDQTAFITMSLGVTLGTAESDPEFLVALADTAMYQAKRKGRNRVEVGTELPDPEAMEVSGRVR